MEFLHNTSQKQNGQILIWGLVLLTVLLFLGGTLVSQAFFASQSARRDARSEVALALAEAGVNRAIVELNKNTGYGGDTFTLGAGEVETTVTKVSGYVRTIQAIAFIPSKSERQYARTVRVRVSSNPEPTSAGLKFGAHVGRGGVDFDDNARVKGNLFSNGTVVGADGAQITGSATVAKGGVEATGASQQAQTQELVFGDLASRTDAAQQFIPASSELLKRVEVYVRKVGNPQNATVRITAQKAGVPDTKTFTQGTLQANQVGSNFGWVQISFDKIPTLHSTESYFLVIDVGGAKAQSYYVWGAAGAQSYGNGDAFTGESFSAGGPWQHAGADAAFKVVVGGSVTSLAELVVGEKAHALTITATTVGLNATAHTIASGTINGSAVAHTITGSTIGGNATAVTVTGSTIGGNLTCETYSGTTVLGQVFCPSAVSPPEDPQPEDLPISAEKIAQWKNDAAAGGTMQGNVEPAKGALVSFGPVRITGDLKLTNGQTLVVAGTIWVQGTITVDNNSTVQLDPAYGGKSGIIITDESIEFGNNVTVQGSGTSGSYLMFVSTSTCNGSGGGRGRCAASNAAININNNVGAIIIYAPYGLVYVANNVSVNQVTADSVRIRNNATIVYEKGIESTEFISGPVGGWAVEKGTWQILE